MRSILLNILDDRCLEARIQVAFDLARGFDGHVTCLQTIPFEYQVSGDIYGNMASQVLPMFHEHANELRKKVESRLANEESPWDWIQQDGWPRHLIPKHALLSDIVVMGACDDAGGDDDYSGIAADVAIHVNTPVLVVPEGSGAFDTGAPVVVAWNGSPEVSQALRSSQPLLQRASNVFIVTVKEKPKAQRFPESAAARYLARHDIVPEVAVEPPLKDGIAATLNHFAEKEGASCIVMGAYGHSRIRELIFGGITWEMMHKPKVPLFLAH